MNKLGVRNFHCVKDYSAVAMSVCDHCIEGTERKRVIDLHSIDMRIVRLEDEKER